MKHEIQVPRINANEDEIVLANLQVQVGEHVQAGQELCTLESTKSAEVLEAHTAGFVRVIAGDDGDMVTVVDVVEAVIRTVDRFYV